MLEITAIEIIEKTRPLQTLTKLVVLEVGDIAIVDYSLRDIQVSTKDGKIRISMPLAQSLIKNEIAIPYCINE